jgi:c-di-GMP-binding flagellar brake protein YcgR
MEKLVYVDAGRRDEIVIEAIARATPCVLAIHGRLGWQTCKSHLVAGSPADQRVAIAVPHAAEGETLPTLGSGERVGLSFRRGHKKCMCATTILGEAVREVDGGRVTCLELKWPETLQELQRRVYYRARPGRRVLVRLWRGGVAGRTETEKIPGSIFSGVMLDLSAGGVRVISTDVAPDTFAEGEPIGCAFSPRARGEPFVLDAVFRHFHYDEDGTASFGLQFVGLEATERGRQQLAGLAQVVSEFQRGEARQRRGSGRDSGVWAR